MLRMFRKVGAWIEEQTGLISMVHEFMDEPLAAGVGWPHALGSAVAFSFIVQLVTGAFMMLYYVPTPDHAYETVEYVQGLAFGQVVRGLHHFGATAMVVFLGLHLLQVFIWGAYKRPRQMIWVIGLALLAITFAFSFTGYLLPWDQKAYWATVVGTNIAGAIPGIGEFLREALRGGEAVGSATLTRFFTVHVFFLPVALELLVIFHIFQVRKHGITPPWAVGEPEEVPKPQRFFPHQIAKDCILAVVILLGLLTLAVVKGAPLEPMANPSDTTYVPRPEWYFFPLFELLKHLPGKYGEFVGAIVLPSLGFLALLLFPYVDRNPHRWPHKRPFAMACMFGVLAVTTFFGVQGVRSTPAKTKLSAQALVGEKVYLDQGCRSCHPINGVGGSVAPDLGVAPERESAALRSLLVSPKDLNPRSIMPPTDLPEPKMLALITFLQEIDEHYELSPTPSVGPKKPYSHSEENWFLAHKFEVRKDPGYCESCHKPSFCQSCHRRRRPDSHLNNWLRYHYGVASESPLYCKACHEKQFCNDCHSQMEHTKDWKTRHAEVSKTRRELCAECHDDETCVLCHEGAKPSSHDDVWLSRHGSAAGEDCQSCHSRRFCQNCHTGAKPASHTANWPRTHGSTARRGQQLCATCHERSFCDSCHGTKMPHPRNFRSLHPQSAKANVAACLRCHKQSWCTQCHGTEMPHPKGFRRAHPTLSQKNPSLCVKCHTPKDCQRCHDQWGRPPSHDKPDFAKGHGVLGKKDPVFCQQCHGKDSCNTCHGGLSMPHPQGWKTKLHAQTAPKNPAACANCHEPKDCAKCHDADNSPESHWEDDYGKTHDDDAKGKEALCALCHGKTGCDDCHKKENVRLP